MVTKEVSDTFGTEAEFEMASKMGITVKELRNQTPEEHMQMMQGMMKQDMNGFLAAQGVDIATLPEAKVSKIIEVSDGDRIELNPTLVRKTILGKEFAMYGYNGQIPGPMIKAKQNATITVDVTNNIDMDTTIHWHGIRLDNANDGVPDVTQEAIQPDGTFTYTVKLLDEGIYWYHPHVREDIQQDLGLYGNLLVTPTKSDAYAPVNQEEIVVLDDLMLDENNMLVPYGEDDATHPLMGRFGNTILTNGETTYEMYVRKGSVVRYYITNVANTRTFNFSFGEAANKTPKMKLVGSDVGRYEREEWVESVIIAPAERYIVDVYFEEAGTYDLNHVSPLSTLNLARVNVLEEDNPENPILTKETSKESFVKQFKTLRSNEDVIADIDDFRKYFDQPIDKTLDLSIELVGGMNHSIMQEEHTDDGSTGLPEPGIEWEDTMPQMNEMMTGDQVEWKLIDTDTGDENMDINWQFKVGDVQKIRVTNNEDSAHPMQHPIHFHGQRFLVLSMDGKQNNNLVWKDTVLIPTGSSVDLLFDISNPGKWMFHCHIAEHLTNGMMGMFTVSK
jgi:FtsP/CotA-like multicopper oxidase with cupredoxin domain